MILLIVWFSLAVAVLAVLIWIGTLLWEIELSICALAIGVTPRVLRDAREKNNGKAKNGK